MRKFLIFTILICGTVFAQNGNKKTLTKEDLDTKMKKASYALGQDMGNVFNTQRVPVDPELFYAGLMAGIKDSAKIFTTKELRNILVQFRQDMITTQNKRRKDEMELQKKAQEEFFKKNKLREEVTVLDNGIQYEILKSGTGKSPTINDSVTVNYRGTLLNGEEFDSSYKTGKPATMALKNLIKGWQEILPRMKEGDKWKVYIPSDLGYGARGSKNIPPHTMLIFEIELISFKFNLQK